jgi:ribonucleotide monophosphatase NagD (HAD superfamily)
MSIIVDIDGTMLARGKTPIRHVIDYVNSQGTVYVITARPESRRAETVAALRSAGVHYNRLLMNSVGPTHKDGIESKRRHARSLSGVTEAIDNDAGVRRMYESLGLKAVNPSSVGKSIWSGVFTKWKMT